MPVMSWRQAMSACFPTCLGTRRQATGRPRRSVPRLSCGLGHDAARHGLPLVPTYCEHRLLYAGCGSIAAAITGHKAHMPASSEPMLMCPRSIARRRGSASPRSRRSAGLSAWRGSAVSRKRNSERSGGRSMQPHVNETFALAKRALHDASKSREEAIKGVVAPGELRRQ